MLTISQLARAGGVGVETIRYYQRRNLLPAPVANGIGIRHYGESDVARLNFIRSAQKAGFTLSEIGDLIELDAENDRAEVRRMANERILALDAEIAELTAARSALAILARECGRMDTGPCPIIGAFQVKTA